MTFQITDKQFKQVFTPDVVKGLQGMVVPSDIRGLTGEECDDLRMKYLGAAFDCWPSVVVDAEGLIAAVEACAKMSFEDDQKFANFWNYMAQHVNKVVATKMALKVPVKAAATGSTPSSVVKSVVKVNLDNNKLSDLGLSVVDGIVKKTVNVEKFKQDVASLVGTLSREQIIKQVMIQSAESNFWDLVLEMLKLDQTYDLIAICAVSQIVGREYSDVIKNMVGRVSVMQNKSGKLSLGLFRLVGFVGLASVSDVKELTHATRFIVNPLSGQSPVDRPLIKKSGESDADLKVRVEKHVKDFAVYKTIMDQMKSYKTNYDALDASVKTKIKTYVCSWCFGT